MDSKNVIELGIVFERYNLNSDEEQPKTSNLVFDDIFAQTVLATQEMYPWCKKGMNIVKRRDQQYLWLGCCSETRRSNNNNKTAENSNPPCTFCVRAKRLVSGPSDVCEKAKIYKVNLEHSCPPTTQPSNDVLGNFVPIRKTSKNCGQAKSLKQSIEGEGVIRYISDQQAQKFVRNKQRSNFSDYQTELMELHSFIMLCQKEDPDGFYCCDARPLSYKVDD